MRSIGSIRWILPARLRTARSVAADRLRTALRRQTGLSIIELIIAIAIIGAIGAAAAGATYQLLTASKQANDEQLAISQLRAAEHWMTRDTLASQAVTPDVDPSGFPLVLTWTSTDGSSNAVTYSMEDSPTGSLKRLQRYHVRDAGTSTTIVGEYIDASLSSCSYSGSTLTVTLTATAGTYTGTRTYESKPRSDTPPP